MPEPITTKQRMYEALAAGRLGNTVPQYFSVAAWRASGDDRRFDAWGVRTLTPGGPCRLNCPAAEVEAAVTLWAEVWDSPTGLVVEGVEGPDTAGGWTWRNSMPDPARRRRWEGVALFAAYRAGADPAGATLYTWPFPSCTRYAEAGVGVRLVPLPV